MRALLAAAAMVCLAACSTLAERADPASDAPEARIVRSDGFRDAASYADALRTWRTAEDIDAWIGARFRYDTARAIRLSETQRQRSGNLPIIPPGEFFLAPEGVCVDLARFAVETLAAIEPAANPKYVMIEFDPVAISGNLLRRHWVVSFERDGRRYFFADSKRPGHIAGPYASTGEFVAEYAAYRGRRIVSFSERASYERALRARATAARTTLAPVPVPANPAPGADPAPGTNPAD